VLIHDPKRDPAPVAGLRGLMAHSWVDWAAEMPRCIWYVADELKHPHDVHNPQRRQAAVERCIFIKR